MFRRLIKPNLIRRFNHTHSKSIFPAETNNKIIEDLLREQNKHLDKIREGIDYFFLALIGIQFTIIFKPIK